MKSSLWCLSLALLPMPSFAEQPVALSVTRLLTDKAVLQRDQPIPVWGTAAPGVEVRVFFGDQKVQAVADSAGEWLIALAAERAEADGRDLVVETSDGQARTLTDVVVGDVWYCAGQSNMELGMAAIANRAQELKDLKYPNLRLYLIPKAASGSPRAEVFGAWVPSDRLSVTSGGWSGFSAVAYTFGRKLTRELNVPVGVIQAAYGGCPVAAWIPPLELDGEASLARYAKQLHAADAQWRTAVQKDPEARHPFDDPSDTRDLGPSSIWRAMLEPLLPAAVRGVLWYQGETDVGDGPLYTTKMKALIAGFRRSFRQPDLPVYSVQLAPWAGYGGDSLPRLWQAQEAALSIPHTGMALTVDVGDFNDIHPVNKRPVGERLALQALEKTYQRPGVVADGPVLKGWENMVGGVLVQWSSHGKLTTVDGNAPAGFEVLSAGQPWKPQSATFTEEGVFLATTGTVSGVRYAWSSTPQVNLTDATGLPARPFSSQTASQH